MHVASAAAAAVFGTAAEVVATLDYSTCLHGALFVLGYAVARRLRRRPGPALARATQASACKSRALAAAGGARQCGGAAEGASAPPSPAESGAATTPRGSPRLLWSTLAAGGARRCGGAAAAGASAPPSPAESGAATTPRGSPRLPWGGRPSPAESGPATTPRGSPRLPWTAPRATPPPAPAPESPSRSSRGAPSPPSPSPAPPSLAVAEVAAVPTVTSALLAAGLGAVLERRCRRRGGAESLPVAKLPALLLDGGGATESCLPLALAYLDRLQRAGAGRAECQGGVCARLALVALVLASKFHDDNRPYTNAYYSELGGVPPGEFDFLEREFCRLIDWDFCVAPEEYERYSDILYSAALESMS